MPIQQRWLRAWAEGAGLAAAMAVLGSLSGAAFVGAAFGAPLPWRRGR